MPAKEAAYKAGQLDAGMDANESLISRYARLELMTDGKLDIQKIILELMGAEIAPLQYHAEMLKYYEAGKSGQNIQSVVDAADAKLTEDMKQAAYAAGLQDGGALTSDSESGIVNSTPKRAGSSGEFDFSAYDVTEDLASVETVKQFISENFPGTTVKLNGIKNADVLMPFVTALKKISDAYGTHFTNIEAADFGNARIVAETQGNTLRINTKFANSIDALNKQLNDWVNSGYIPAGCNNINYIANHEFFHLLTQDAIDEPNSKIVTAIRRAMKNGCEMISKNANVNGVHEFVADLLVTKKLTAKQFKLRNQILDEINGGD